MYIRGLFLGTLILFLLIASTVSISYAGNIYFSRLASCSLSTSREEESGRGIFGIEEDQTICWTLGIEGVNTKAELQILNYGDLEFSSGKVETGPYDAYGKVVFGLYYLTGPDFYDLKVIVGSKDGFLCTAVGLITKPTAVSSKGTYTEEDTFRLEETVYCYVEGLPLKQYVDIYIVPSRTDWTKGASIGSDVSSDDVNRDVWTGIDGQFLRTIGSLDELGEYDIVVDVDKDRVYNGCDAIDSLTTVGFFVIPELPLGTVTALLSALAALTLFKKRSVIRIKP